MSDSDINPGGTEPSADSRLASRIREVMAKASANATALSGILSGTAGPLDGAGQLVVVVAGLKAAAPITLTVAGAAGATGAAATTVGYRVAAQAAGTFTIEAYATVNGAAVAGDATAAINWIADNR